MKNIIVSTIMALVLFSASLEAKNFGHEKQFEGDVIVQVNFLEKPDKIKIFDQNTSIKQIVEWAGKGFFEIKIKLQSK